MDRNNCEMKLYSKNDYRGNNIGFTGGINSEFDLKVVKSLEVLGPCCWEIKKEKKSLHFKPGTRGNFHIPTPFTLRRKKCPHSNSKLLNYLYTAGLNRK